MSKLAPITYRPATSAYESKRKFIAPAQMQTVKKGQFTYNAYELKNAQNMMEKFTSKIPKQRITEARNKDVSIQEITKSVEYIKETEVGRYISEFQSNIEDQGEFIYLAQKEPTDCYDLQRVSFQETETVYNGRYWTLSKKGFTEYYYNKPVDFLSTTDWLIEKAYFEKVSELSFFKNFRKWKAYKQWHRKIIFTKRHACQTSIEGKSFLVNNITRNVLYTYRQEFFEVLYKQRLRLFNFNITYKDCTFDEFLHEQSLTGDNAQLVITNLSNRLRTLYTEAMSSIISKLKDEFNKDALEELDIAKVKIVETKRMQVLDEVYERLGFPQRLSYKQKSELRKECISFIRMSYLLDFFVQEFLRELFFLSRDEIDACFTKLNTINITRQNTAKKDAASKESNNPLFKLNVELANILTVNEDMFEEVEIPDINLGLEQEENVKIFDPLHHLTYKNSTDPIQVKKLVPKDLHLQWLEITPNKKTIAQRIYKQLDQNIKALSLINRWSKSDDLALYASVLEEWDDKVADQWEITSIKYVKIDDTMREEEDKGYLRREAMINDHISQAFKRCQQFFANLEGVLYIHWRNTQLDYNKFANENLNHLAEIYKLMFKQFEHQRASITSSIVDEAPVGMIKLRLASIREKLLEENKIHQKKFEEAIKPFINSQYYKAQQWIANSIESLSDKIHGRRPEYIKRLETLKKIKDEMQYYSDKIDLLYTIHCVLNEWKVPLPKEDDDKELNNGYHKLMEEVSTKEEKCMKNREKFKKIIEQEVADLLVAIDGLENDINENKFLNKESIAPDMIKQLAALNVTYEKLLALSVVYLHAVNIMQLQDQLEKKFEKLGAIKSSIDLKIELWNSTKEWTEYVSVWSDLMFENINTSEITTKASYYYKSVLKCDKELPESSAVKELKENIRIFKEAMPVVIAFSNKDLTNKQWIKMQKLVDTPFVLKEKKYTLNQLLKSKVIEFASEIITISESATQEKQLSSKITNIDSFIKEKVLTQAVYKEGTDMYVLSNCDEIISDLEEQLIIVNTIIGSKYVSTVEVKIKSLKESINNLVSYLTILKKTQDNWRTLERVFSASGIKSLLIKEAQEFEVNDKQWKAIIKKLGNKKAFESIVNNKELAKAIVDISKKLEICVKRLYDYIETKRKDSPRLYLISDIDLLNIIHKYNDFSFVEHLIPFTFNGIQSLITDAPDNKNPSKLLGFNSVDGEKFDFKNPFPIKYDKNEGLGTWINGLEKFTNETLRVRLKLCYQEVLDKYNDGKKGWILDYPPQIVYMVFHVMWTEGCQLCIDNIERGMREQGNFASMYEDQLDNLQQLWELTKDDTLPAFRLKMIYGLISYIIYSRDIIEQLSDSSLSGASSFIWQRQFKYLIEAKNMKVHVLDKTIDYSFEYYSILCPLPVTESIEKAWISLISSFSLNYSSLLHGKMGVGKSEIVFELAKVFGVLAYSFQCNKYTDIDALVKPTNGCCQCGFWLILDNLQEVSQDILSVYGHILSEVYKAIASNKPLITINDRDYEMKFVTPNPFSLFVINDRYPMSYPKELKKNLRPTLINNPDIKIILKYSLELLHINDFNKIANQISQALSELDNILCQTTIKFSRLIMIKKIIEVIKSLKVSTLTQELLHIVFDKMLKSTLPLGVLQDAYIIVTSIFGEREPTQNNVCNTLKECAHESNLQMYDLFESSFHNFKESIQINNAIIIIGEPGIGKSSLWKLLKSINIKEGKKVLTRIFNINSTTPQQLVGPIVDKTGYKNGTLPRILSKEYTKDKSTDIWFIIDGIVDNVWVSVIKSFIGHDKSLCMLNGDKLSIPSNCKTIIETTDISAMDPAVLHRSSLIYMKYDNKIVKNYFISWLSTLKLPQSDDMLSLQLQNLFDDCTERAIKLFNKEHESLMLPVSLIQQVQSFCKLLNCFFTTEMGIEENKFKSKKMITYFAFAFIWAFGGALQPSVKPHFDEIVRIVFTKVPIPVTSSVFDFGWINEEEYVRISHWSMFGTSQTKQNADTRNKNMFSIYIPNDDSKRIDEILRLLNLKNYPVAVVGPPCVGKTTILSNYAQKLVEQSSAYTLILNKIPTLSSDNVLSALEVKIDRKKSNNAFGPYGSKILCFIVDDVNVPTDVSKTISNPDETLRQIVDQLSYYTPDVHRKLIDIWPMLVADSTHWDNPPTRLLRHFITIGIHNPSEECLKGIYEQYLYYNFTNESHKAFTKIIAAACFEYENRLSTSLNLKWRELSSLRSMLRICKFTSFQCNSFKNGCSEDEVYNIWVSNALKEVCGKILDPIYKEQSLIELADIASSKLRLSTTKADLDGDNSFLYIYKNLNENAGYYLAKDSVDLIEECKPHIQVINNIYDNFQGDNIQITSSLAYTVFKLQRVLLIPNGHCALVGSGGRQIITKIAANILGYLVTEPKPENKRSTKKSDFYLKVVESYKTKKPLVVILNDKDKEYLDIISEMMDMITLGKCNIELAKEEYDSISLMESKDGIKKSPEVLYKIFYSGIIELLHFVIFTDKNRITELMSMHKNLCNSISLIHIHEWAQPDYERYCFNELWKEINSEEAKQLGQVVGNIFFQIEPAIKKLVPLFCQKNATSFSHRYAQIYNKKKRQIDIENELYGKIVAKLDFVKQQSEKLQDQLNNAAPQMAQLQLSIDALKPVKNEINKKLMAAEAEVESVSSKLGSVTQRIELATDDIKKQERVMIEQYQRACRDLSMVNELLKYANDLYKQDNPPPSCSLVMSTVLTALAEDNVKWDNGRAFMMDTGKLDVLKKFSPENLSEKNFKIMKGNTVDPLWNPIEIEKNKPMKYYADWCFAVVKYKEIYKSILPQKDKKEKANKEYNELQDSLKNEQINFDKINAQNNKIENEFTQLTNQLQNLKASSGETNAKKENADKYIKYLGNLYKKWDAKLKQNQHLLGYLKGTALMESSFFEIISPLSSIERSNCANKIISICQEMGILIEPNYHLMQSPSLLLEAESVSFPISKYWMDNIQLMSSCEDKYPVIIDPEGVMKSYITKTEKKIVVLSYKTRDSLDTIISCLNDGTALLLEDIEKSDEILRPLFDKELHNKIRSDTKSSNLIIIGEKKYIMANGFKVYGITKNHNILQDNWFYKSTLIINNSLDEESMDSFAFNKCIHVIDAKMMKTKEDLSRITLALEKTIADKEISIADKFSKSSNDALFEDAVLLSKIQAITDEVALSSKQYNESKLNIEHKRSSFDKFREISTQFTLLLKIAREFQAKVKLFIPDFVAICNLFTDTIKSIQMPSESSEIDYINLLIKKITCEISSQLLKSMPQEHKIVFLLRLIQETKHDSIIKSKLAFLMEDIPMTIEDKPSYLDVDSWSRAKHLSHTYASDFGKLTDSLLKSESLWKNYLSTSNLPHAFSKLSTLDKLLLAHAINCKYQLPLLMEYLKAELGEDIVNTMNISWETHLSKAIMTASQITPVVLVCYNDLDILSQLEAIRQSNEVYQNVVISTFMWNKAQESKIDGFLEKNRNKGNWAVLLNGRFTNKLVHKINQYFAGIPQIELESPNTFKFVIQFPIHNKQKQLTGGICHLESIALSYPLNYLEYHNYLKSSNHIGSTPFNNTAIMLLDCIQCLISQKKLKKFYAIKSHGIIYAIKQAKSLVNAYKDSKINLKELFNYYINQLMLPSSVNATNLQKQIKDIDENESKYESTLLTKEILKINNALCPVKIKTVKKALSSLSTEEFSIATKDKYSKLPLIIESDKIANVNQKDSTTKASTPLFTLVQKEAAICNSVISEVKSKIVYSEKQLFGQGSLTIKGREIIDNLMNDRIIYYTAHSLGYMITNEWAENLQNTSNFFKDWLSKQEPLVINLQSFSDFKAVFRAIIQTLANKFKVKYSSVTLELKCYAGNEESISQQHPSGYYAVGLKPVGFNKNLEPSDQKEELGIFVLTPLLDQEPNTLIYSNTKRKKKVGAVYISNAKKKWHLLA